MTTSEENPFQAPATDAAATKAPQLPPENALPREELIKIAKFQDWLMYVLLLSIATGAVAIFGAERLDVETLSWLRPLFIGVHLLAVVCIVLLALRIYPLPMTIFLAALALSPLFAFVPYANLFALIIVNTKATTVLKKHGIRVGLLGAKRSDIQ